MPAGPKILHVNTEKWHLEILWQENSENVRRPDSHTAVPGKIEKQIERVAVHIGDGSKQALFRQRLQPAMPYQAAENEAGERAEHQLPNAAAN